MRVEDWTAYSMQVLRDTKERIELSRAADQSHRNRLVVAMQAIRLSLARIEKSDRLIGRLWGFEGEQGEQLSEPHSKLSGSRIAARS